MIPTSTIDTELRTRSALPSSMMLRALFGSMAGDKNERIKVCVSTRYELTKLVRALFEKIVHFPARKRLGPVRVDNLN